MTRLHFVITDLEIGGTPRVVRDLAIRLRAFDFDTAVTCLSPWGPVADELKDAGVPVNAIGATSAKQLPAAVRKLRSLTADADVIFSFLIHANTIATLANAGRPIRLLQAIQTTQPYPTWHWWLQGIVGRYAAAVVMPSASAAEAAMAWSGLPAERLVVIPNAVDLPGAIHRTKPDSQWRIGFVGRLDPVKRVPDLIAAIARVPDVSLDVYGDGTDRPAVEAAVRLFDVSSRVTLHGTVSSAADALSSIDTLVLPSDAEGFGLVLIEAMAARVPVIATNVAGVRDVVQNGLNGLLVPPRDPAALAASIVCLQNDERLRQRLIENGLRVVAEHYTWDAVLPCYAALLHPSIGAKASGVSPYRGHPARAGL